MSLTTTIRILETVRDALEAGYERAVCIALARLQLYGYGKYSADEHNDARRFFISLFTGRVMPKGACDTTYGYWWPRVQREPARLLAIELAIAVAKDMRADEKKARAASRARLRRRQKKRRNSARKDRTT